MIVLEHLERMQDDLRRAGVLLAVDAAHEVAVFGRAALESVVKSGEGRSLIVLRIPIDSSETCDDLERLCAAPQTYRGRHEYRNLA
jgi:hypothetical protein